ncbi:MAG: HAD family hydrolase [Thermoplasmata archaeon]
MSSAPKPPALVLLDMDDTIFDHSLTCRAALRELRRSEPRLAVRSLDDLWHAYLTRLKATDLTLGWVGHSDQFYEDARAARFSALAREAGWECDRAEGRALSTLYRTHYQRLRRPVPGAIEFVRRTARSVPVGIVTNNQVSEQEQKLKFLGLTDSVAHLIVSEAVGVEKPNPEIFRAALSAARVGPREAVMVGDSWTNDVLGARAAGIRPVWFNRFGRPRPTRPRVEEIASFRPARVVERVIRGVPARRGRPRR